MEAEGCVRGFRCPENEIEVSEIAGVGHDMKPGSFNDFVAVEGLRRGDACIPNRVRLVAAAAATRDLSDRCRRVSSTKAPLTMGCRSQLGCTLHCLHGL